MDPYAAQTFPPPPSSQIQPPNQDPYLYNQPQPYPYYPPQIPQQQYPNPNPVYQQHVEQEPAPIHPPGVPVPNDPNHIAAYQHGYAQPHFPNDPYYQQPPQPQPLSYPDAGVVHQGQQQWQQQGQTAEFGLTALYPPNGQGRGGGRGGFRGGSSSFGRGRGKGRNGKLTIGEPKPRAMAWCELCRVDCNTLEILENHKNGKKHKKNLKIQDDLQKLASATSQIPSAPESQIPPIPESEQQRNGIKRKELERKVVEPAKKQQREIVPFICELCNVKCESGPTFDSHLKGKKHVMNLQRFQEQQASLGQAALNALYPALLHAFAQNANVSSSTPLDQQLLQWLQAYIPQTGPAVIPQGPGPSSVPVPVPGPSSVPVVGATQEGVKEGDEVKGEEVKPEEEVKQEPEVEVKKEAEEKEEVEAKQ